MTFFRYLLCSFLGHRPVAMRLREPVGDGEARTYGWRCRRCGWRRVQVDFVGLTDEQYLKLRHILEQREARHPGLTMRTVYADED